MAIAFINATISFTNTTIKNLSHTILACYSCKILACCMQQNNKLEFQRNIKLEFSQTYHNFNQSLRNTGKLSIFKEYAVQYSNKMEESLGSIWHKKDAASITHTHTHTHIYIYIYIFIPQLQTLRTWPSLTSYGYPQYF